MDLPQLKIGSVWIDVSLSEKYQFSAEVTEHPVEKDSDIADHVRALPKEIEVEGIITDHPVNSPGSHAGQRTRGVFDTLSEMINTSTLTSLVSGLEIYDNIVLTNLSIHRSPDTGPHAYRFTCTAHQIRFVSTQSAPKPKVNAGKPKDNRGNQTSRPLTESEKPVVDKIYREIQGNSDTLISPYPF